MSTENTPKKDIKLALEEIWAKEDELSKACGDGQELESASPGGKRIPSVEALEQAVVQAEEMRELAMRMKAEFENFRRRTQAEKAQWTYQALEGILNDLLSVADDFDRALTAARRVPGGEAVVEGVEMIARRLMNVLTAHGVEHVECVGESFNPEIHDAVMREFSADAAPGTVLEVLQPGYRFKEQILRHPKVKVAVEPEREGSEAGS